MLTLPIKKKWYDMILSGEKKEEYRQYSPYWIKRFENIGLLQRTKSGEYKAPIFVSAIVKFRNGYSKNSPSFDAKIGLVIGAGKTEWGAKKGEKYLILRIEAIYKRSDKKTEVNIMQNNKNRTCTVIEVCSYCMNEIEMVWNTDIRGYKAFCPVCGERLMICSECEHAEDFGGKCDYNTKSDTCMRNKAVNKNGSTGKKV